MEKRIAIPIDLAFLACLVNQITTKSSSTGKGTRVAVQVYRGNIVIVKFPVHSGGVTRWDSAQKYRNSTRNQRKVYTWEWNWVK